MRLERCHVVPSRFALLALTVLWPAAVRAETIQSHPDLSSGSPLDGDRGVPTDVVPIYFEVDPWLKGEFAWTASDGRVVIFEAVRAFTQYVDLVPAQPLEPRTTYTIHATWTPRSGATKEDELTFTTGDGPLKQGSQAPELLLTSFALSEKFREGMCVAGTSTAYAGSTGTCLLVRDPKAWLDLTMIDNSGQEHIYKYRMQGSGTIPLSVDDSPLSTDFPCADARVRAANGERSSPTRLCIADFPTRAIHDRNTPLCPLPEGWEEADTAALHPPLPVRVDDSLCAPQDGDDGCSAALGSQRSTGLTCGLLFVALSLLRRRRL
jgi:hypothetical protein